MADESEGTAEGDAGGDVIATVRAGEVDWVCDHADGSREACFETGLAVAALLVAEVAFVNAPWYRDDLAEADRAVARLLVNCNDVFAWACSDAEPLPMADIERVYRAWRADPAWGPAAWCIARRGQPAQGPVADILRKAGTWDPDRLHAERMAYLDLRLAELAREAAPAAPA